MHNIRRLHGLGKSISVEIISWLAYNYLLCTNYNNLIDMTHHEKTTPGLKNEFERNEIQMKDEFERNEIQMKLQIHNTLKEWY
jgi:hypothetical protein